jgi:hypothetical protein
MVGTGAAVAAAGTVTYWMAWDRTQEANDLRYANEPEHYWEKFRELEDEADTLERTSWVLWGIGAAIVGTGGYFVIAAPTGDGASVQAAARF